MDVNNVAQCALSKLTSTSMNYSVKQSYSEQDLMDDRLIMDLCGYLNVDDTANTATTVGDYPYPADFVMIPSLFGMTALYSVRLHSDPFYTLRFEKDDFIMTSNPFKRSVPMSDDDDNDDDNDDDDDDEDVGDTFMNDEPLAKRLKY